MWQLVVNRDESHDRPGRPDVKRDTCHESANHTRSLVVRQNSVLNTENGFVDPGFCFFETNEHQQQQNLQTQLPTRVDPTPHEKRKSRTTSFTEGGSIPVLHAGRRPSNDTANDLAAVHARMPSHRRERAALTRPRKIGGWLRDFAFAKACTKDAASSEKRPPTSAANTTNRARPSSPVSSGCVMVFILRTEGQLRCGWPLCGVLCHLCAVGDTNVVSMASWEPLHKEAVCHHLQPAIVQHVVFGQAVSRTYTLELTRAPVSPSPKGTHASPAPLPQKILLGGGQEGHGDGHTCRSERTEGGEGGDDA